VKKIIAISSTMALFLWSTVTRAAQESQAKEILNIAPTHSGPILLWGCALLAIIIFGVSIYSVVAFHASPASTAHARDKTHGLARELAWALVPIAIVVATATPAMKGFTPRLNSGATSAIAKTVGGNSADHCVALQTSSLRATVVRAIYPAPCSTPR